MSNRKIMLGIQENAPKLTFCACYAGLKADQVNALAIALAENDQIQELNLSDNFLTDVEPDLSRAVAQKRKLLIIKGNIQKTKTGKIASKK